MPNPIIFSPETNGDDPSMFVARSLGPVPGGGQLMVVDYVRIYRFGNRTKAWDWLSPCRQTMKGGFDRASPSSLNNSALYQVRFGRKSDAIVMKDIPFVSVGTSYQRLYMHGEPWVQKILQDVPDLGVFDVPYTCVIRPSINSAASKMETEWLYFDGEHPITHYLVEWRLNPYKTI